MNWRNSMTRTAVLACACACTAAGCSATPATRLSEATERNRALTAEIAVLRDQVTRLRSQNSELAQRNLDDSDRIDQLREANARLERSIAAYQSERSAQVVQKPRGSSGVFSDGLDDR